MKRINEESYADPRESYEQLLSQADEEIKPKVEETWKENGGTNEEADYETLRNAYIEAERVWKEHEKLKAREEMTDNLKDTFVTSENKIPRFDVFEQEDSVESSEAEETEEEEETRTDIAGSDEREKTRQQKLEAVTRLSDGLSYVRTLTTAENLDRLSDRALDELYQLIKNAKTVKEAEVHLYENTLIIKGDDGKEVQVKLDGGSVQAVEEEGEDYKMGKTPSPAPDDEVRMETGKALGEEYEEDQKILTKLVNLVQKNDVVMVFAPNRHVKHIVIDDVTDINMAEGSIIGLTEDGEEILFYPQDIEFVDLPGNKRLSFNDLSESLGKIRSFDFYFRS